MFALVLILLFTIPHAAYSSAFAPDLSGIQLLNRWQSAYSMLINQEASYNIATENNGDDANVNNYAGSFTKALEHDMETGVLTSDGSVNYRRLLTALTSGLQADFNAIERSSEAILKFVNPQAAFTQSLIGPGATTLPMISAPTLTSAQTAAELIELYLAAISRDVQFSDYGTGEGTDENTILEGGGSITDQASAMLTALGTAYKGPLNDDDEVDPSLLFRTRCYSDRFGPFISQFLWQNVWFYQQVARQQYVPIAQTREFGVAWDYAVAINNGAIPQPYSQYDFGDTNRYIITGRDLATIVHYDAPGDFFWNAVNILTKNNVPYAPGLPYEKEGTPNETGFVTFSIGDVAAALFVAEQEALKHAWAHKWLASRRLRPEAMSLLVQTAQVSDTNPYDLDDSLFGTLASIDLLAWVQARNTLQQDLTHNALTPPTGETYLLGLVYPEGAPVHPSYPSGHAVVAGACSTIVKAFFDMTHRFNVYLQPVKPDPADPTALVNLTDDEGANTITIDSELDKLASNIVMGRWLAGVNFRSDAEQGLLLGEQVAMKVLQEFAGLYHESGFIGFTIMLRSGQRYRITKAGAHPLPS